MTTDLLLMKNVLPPFIIKVLVPLRFRATSSATDEAIQKKKKNWTEATVLIISNKEMGNIMKIVKSIEQSVLLIKVLAKQLNMKQNHKEWISW